MTGFNRRSFISKTAAMLAFSSCNGLQAKSDTARPNILLILSDDVGWGDFKCYNPASKIPSDGIDRLARNGMLFTHAHTPAALCSPTRYSMLTGNYPWRGRNEGGVWGFNSPSNLKPGQKTVANMIQHAGYRTAMFGKAGFGGFFALSKNENPEKQLAPEEWGFDYSYIIPKGHQASPLAYFENGYPTTELDPDSKYDSPHWDKVNVGETLLTKAEAFLDRHLAEHASAPFYMHFCTDGAHSPFIPPASINGTPVKGVTDMGPHSDMVMETDILTIHLIKALEQRNLLNNTLIIVTSDNGGLPYERDKGHDAVAGLRGKKGYIFEGGTRVPFVACWPGKIPAGTTRNQVICTHDTVATVLELAGVPIPADQALDSVSLVPVFLGEQDDSKPARESLLVQCSAGKTPQDDGGFRANQPEPKKDKSKKKANSKSKKDKKTKKPGMTRALYQGDWKLVFDGGGNPEALYNLKDDLIEEQNEFNNPEQAGRIKKMTTQFNEIMQSERSTPTMH